VSELFDQADLVHTAVLNYISLKSMQHPEAVKVAWIRAYIASRGVSFVGEHKDIENHTKYGGKELAEAGWDMYTKYSHHSETLVKSSSNLVRINEQGVIMEYNEQITELINFTQTEEFEAIPILAVVLPIMASIQFQKTNHHYIQNDDYKNAYERHFRSAQISSLEKSYNKASIIYDSVHWMGPYMMIQWIQNNLKAQNVPRGLLLKANPPPAGTAIVFTQLAVWDQISVYPGTEDLVKAYDGYLKEMRHFANDVRTSRLSYHVYAPLFGLKGLLDATLTEKGMIAASQLAAIAQAFIDSVAKDSDISKAKALLKRAQQNMALYRVAKEAFAGSLVQIRKQARIGAVSDTLVPVVKRALPPPVVNQNTEGVIIENVD